MKENLIVPEQHFGRADFFFFFFWGGGADQDMDDDDGDDDEGVEMANVVDEVFED